MIKIDNLETPSPEQFNVVIGGMRNAFKSYDRTDSEICKGETVDKNSIRYCFGCGKECTPQTECFILGEKDEKLANNLVSGDSPSHRKFLRQLPLIMNITAPLYFWKQLDTYKVGTTANSESTMHTLTKYPFKLEDFSTEFINSVDSEKNNWFVSSDYDFDGLVLDDGFIDLYEYFEYYFLGLLNILREKYLKTKDMNYWYLLNELLPQSYNQKRTWSANYEVVLTIIAQRIHHKLPEWRNLINYWLKNIPYLIDFALADGVIRLKNSNVVINDSDEILFSLEDEEIKR